MARYRLGVDIGGTFTDLVVYDQQEQIFHTHKTLTTPQNLAEGVMESIDKYIKDFDEIEYFVHGTTSGLNALLERKGANVAMIVTKGFRDVYEIGRANRIEMYNIQYKKPEPLMDRKHIYEIDERTTYDGKVLKEVNKDELDSLVQKLKREKYDAVAVCLLHSYRNPNHEREILEKITSELNIPVSLSSEIAREWREYERVSTTVVNAYVAPIVNKYLTLLEKEMINRGYEKDIYIMQSNGGVMTSKVAKRLPLQTLMSGPVGGTIGCVNLTDQLSENSLIAVDMGGTSFDVSLAIDGKPDVTSETIMEGHPILSPMVNIHTIGAGGGSIAYLEGGGLRVGPRSAGSNPGPACYGNGGVEPTVTDANLILGRIDPDNLGSMKLDKEAAYKAVERIANEIGLSVEKTAEGIVDIANAKMADAIRNITVRKGIDPRELTMVAYGGAGPMHAALIGELLGIGKIIVPNASGTFSARGMLQTDIRYDTVRNYVAELSNVDQEFVKALFKEMEIESKSVLNEQNIKTDQIRFQKSFDIRYVGQEYTVNVHGTENNIEKLGELFHSSHLEIYGHNNRNNPMEIVNLRLTAYGDLEKLQVKEIEKVEQREAQPKHSRECYWDGVKKTTGVYSTAELGIGNYFNGPAIIEDKSSTIVVPANRKVLIDKNNNISIEKYNVSGEE